MCSLFKKINKKRMQKEMANFFQQQNEFLIIKKEVIRRKKKMILKIACSKDLSHKLTEASLVRFHILKYRLR